MNEILNRIFIKFSKRAEKIDRKKLVESFVDVGPLLTVLSTVDNQVLYGRRGTGKTHALVYLGESVKKNGDVSVYIDLRNIGSTGGIYSDHSIPFAERATRLLMDALAAIHSELMDIVLDDSQGVDISKTGPLLDEFANAITEVIVRGEQEEERSATAEKTEELGHGAKLTVNSKSAEIGAELHTEKSTKMKTISATKIHGQPEHRVHFGRVRDVLTKICSSLNGRHIWVILDEWSVVPADLQPYLADLLRRSLFPVSAVTIKIGAIEKRSYFQIPLKAGDYIGIELGGDASADLNMDDFMVFDYDECKATEFYRSLIFKHFRSICEQEKIIDVPRSAADLIKAAFTQENVFKEFVRAAEGVPRDAFYILSLAAQKSQSEAVTMDNLRKASKTWYQRDKESAVASSPDAMKLLHWIIDKVIGHRRSRAFLLERSISHELIDRLFDARVLHLLKRNISAHDQPGIRYDVYKIDYGCYVDLLSTARSPESLLMTDLGEFINVPPDDYRSTRRAILDISEFEKAAESSEVRSRGDTLEA